MAPCLTDHDLGRLQHGELSDHDRGRFEAHARECPGCSTRIKQIKQLNGSVDLNGKSRVASAETGSRKRMPAKLGVRI